MEKEGYEKMSAPGRTMCEYLELCERYWVEERRKDRHPAAELPSTLVSELGERRARFNDLEQAAVADFRSGGGPRWDVWLEQHLQANPQDAQALLLLTCDLHPLSNMRMRYGEHDFPWRMVHSWGKVSDTKPDTMTYQDLLRASAEAEARHIAAQADK